MSRADRIALLFSLLGILAGAWIADHYFERLAHLEDEMAYVWQAQAISRGYLTLPSPEHPKSFLQPFVVDYHGRRFGKYPLGWPVVLALGVLLNIRHLVNPLLGGLGVWLTYRLGKRTLGETAGLIAVGLTVTSPFYLMNTGSLLSHPLGLVLSAAFALSWLDAFTRPYFTPRWLPTLTAALSIGVLALTRPLTCAAVAFPFAIHGLYLLLRGDRPARRRLLAFGLLALAVGLLHFAWQYAVTGNPFTNPYTLWWEYDKIGFGPGYGVTSGGHDLEYARVNTRFSLWVGYRDLFGWAMYSWVFLPFGLLAIWNKPKTWLLCGVFPSIVIAYMAYWIGSWLLGPRYYYEGLYSLTLLSSAGICFLAGWPLTPAAATPQPASPPTSKWLRIRRLGIAAILALLIAANLLFYTPRRLDMMHGLYRVQASYLEIFRSPSAQKLAPALVVVHVSGKWIEYGRFLELENPFLDTPFIFIKSENDEVDQEIMRQFPDRSVYHYYPDTPEVLYSTPRP